MQFIYDIDTVELTRGVDFMCGCIYGLIGSHTVSHLCQFYKSFKNHTQLSRIHSNGPSATRVRPWLVWLYVYGLHGWPTV